MPPARIVSIAPMTPSSPTTVSWAWSIWAGRRLEAIRSRTQRRLLLGFETDSIPARVSPRKMNGMTVVDRPGPPARPLAATQPS